MCFGEGIGWHLEFSSCSNTMYAFKCVPVWDFVIGVDRSAFSFMGHNCRVVKQTGVGSLATASLGCVKMIKHKVVQNWKGNWSLVQQRGRFGF